MRTLVAHQQPGSGRVFRYYRLEKRMNVWDFLDRHYAGLSGLVVLLALLITFLLMGYLVEKTKRVQADADARKVEARPVKDHAAS